MSKDLLLAEDCRTSSDSAVERKIRMMLFAAYLLVGILCATVIYFLTRPCLFSLIWPLVSDDVDKGLAREKLALFREKGEIKGDVLEIGAGVGANVKYYDPAKVTSLILNEPCVRMHKNLRDVVSSASPALLACTKIIGGGAEDLKNIKTKSVDVVVCTLVLCSVADPVQVLQEVQRVLRDGGRFVFMEHVAAPKGTNLRSRQDFWNPCWTCLPLDGCRVNVETDKMIERMKGFVVVGEMQRFEDDSGPRIAAPTVAGVVRTVNT